MVGGKASVSGLARAHLSGATRTPETWLYVEVGCEGKRKRRGERR